MTASDLLPSRPVRTMRHRVRSRLSEHPALYLPIARHRYPGPSPEVIGPSTRLVIDGYTRSASTFMVYSVQVAQPEPIRMAHHLHAPAQLIEAARRRIPTLLLVRQPRDALLSQVLREPGVTLRDAMMAYARFHERLLPYLDSFIIADFEEITQDPAGAVRRLNAQFDLSLREPEPADRELVDAFVECRGLLSPILLGFESGTTPRADAMTELQSCLRRSTESGVREQWRPSAERTRSKEQLVDQWNSARYTPLRERADSVYRRCIAHSKQESAP